MFLDRTQKIKQESYMISSHLEIKFRPFHTWVKKLLWCAPNSPHEVYFEVALSCLEEMISMSTDSSFNGFKLVVSIIQTSSYP